MKRFFEKIKTNFPKDRPTQIILGVMVILALVGAVYGFRLARQIVSTNETFSLPGDPVLNTGAEEDGTAAPGETEAVPQPTDPVAASLPTPEPWDGVSRVNVLVMGLDYRDWEAGETPRTDTMILLSLDPLNNTAGMISIPRDLWVSIPGFDYGKINTAYYLGEVYNLPGGGAALAARTVEELLGVPVHYYAQIDFQAFVDFIDHIEGVKIDFPEPMVLDRRGKWNTVTVGPGRVTLPGEYALAYARTRSSEGGDFDRSTRQQILIMAIRDRILDFNMMPKLVANAPQIYEDLAAGINTNMGLNEAIRLAWSALEVDRENISQVIISNEYVTLGKSPDGLDILKPIPDKIRLLRDEVFGTGGALGPVAAGDLLELVAQEGARVSVRNGSYQAGLAANTASWLKDQGFNIVEEANADYSVYSQIYIYNGTPYALQWLSETMGVSSSYIFNQYDPTAAYDIVVVLGDDWAANNPMP
jgi:polyisoprenyl-teichoic acid--peptidoglycan teichoic acid transferase